ncbi:MAG: YggS family pyridoxal phosphate-dependent enzyme [Planctomycetota bacterium]|jgi:pyridoxal phosphate enzyme (YggS family)
MSETSLRVQTIRERIAAAQARSGRSARAITLIAVTKYHPASMVDAVAGAGVLDVGESRVQEALEKSPRVSAPVRWHLIGHLQRNKAKRAAEFFDVIHSVDSTRLVEALARSERRLEIFLQVNVSGEQTKSGVAPESVRGLLQAVRAAPNLAPLGLMTMAPFSGDPEDARPAFRTLYELQSDLNAEGDGPPLEYRSMGMSGDFEVAVEEGATHIRIGTAITGGRSQTGG